MLIILKVLLPVLQYVIFFLKPHRRKEAVNGSLKSHFRKNYVGFIIAITGMALKTQTQGQIKGIKISHFETARFQGSLLSLDNQFSVSLVLVIGRICQSCTVSMG